MAAASALTARDFDAAAARLGVSAPNFCVSGPERNLKNHGWAGFARSNIMRIFVSMQ